MAKEKDEKDLLFKDLCARLPYGVKLRYVEDLIVKKESHTITLNNVYLEHIIMGDADIKPYLRPISSMTEKEIDKLFDILHIDKEGKGEDWIKINDSLGIKFFLPTGRWVEKIDEALNYLRSIHIDIHDFIPKGLALEAKEGMYK